jgi:hypothetical protein
VRHLVDAATNRLRQQLTLLSHSVPMQGCDSAISIELFLRVRDKITIDALTI